MNIKADKLMEIVISENITLHMHTGWNKANEIPEIEIITTKGMGLLSVYDLDNLISLLQDYRKSVG